MTAIQSMLVHNEDTETCYHRREANEGKEEKKNISWAFVLRNFSSALRLGQVPALNPMINLEQNSQLFKNRKYQVENIIWLKYIYGALIILV